MLWSARPGRGRGAPAGGLASNSVLASNLSATLPPQSNSSSLVEFGIWAGTAANMNRKRHHPGAGSVVGGRSSQSSTSGPGGTWVGQWWEGPRRAPEGLHRGLQTPTEIPDLQYFSKNPSKPRTIVMFALPQDALRLHTRSQGRLRCRTSRRMTVTLAVAGLEAFWRPERGMSQELRASAQATGRQCHGLGLPARPRPTGRV